MLFGEHRFETQAKDLVRQTLGRNKVTETILIHKSNSDQQKAHLRFSSPDSVSGAFGDAEAKPRTRPAEKERPTIPPQNHQLPTATRDSEGSSAAKRRPLVGEPIKVFKGSVAVVSKLKQPRTALVKDPQSSAHPKPQDHRLRDLPRSSGQPLAEAQPQIRRPEASTEANSELHKQTESTTRRSAVGSLVFCKPHKKKVEPLDLKIDPASKLRVGGLSTKRQQSEGKASAKSDRLLAGHKASQLIKSTIMRCSPRAEKSKSNKNSLHKLDLHFKLPNRRLHSVDSTPDLHSQTLSDKKNSSAADTKICRRNPASTPAVSNLISPKITTKADSPSRLLAMLSSAATGRHAAAFFRQKTAADSGATLDLGLSRHFANIQAKRAAPKPVQPSQHRHSRPASQSSLAAGNRKSKRSATVLSEAQEVAQEHEKLMSRIAILNRDMWPDIESHPK